MEDRHQARPQHNFSLPWPLTNQKRLIRRRRMLLISSFGHSLNAACSVIFFQALPSLRSPPKTCHRISSFFSPSHPVHSSIYLTSNGHLAVKQRKNKKKTFCALRGPVTNMTLFYFKENSLLVSLIVDGLKWRLVFPLLALNVHSAIIIHIVSVLLMKTSEYLSCYRPPSNWNLKTLDLNEWKKKIKKLKSNAHLSHLAVK